MKEHVFLAVMLFWAGIASATEEPRTPCLYSPQCSTAMRQDFAAFLQSDSLVEADWPAVYSGVCRHSGYGYNARDEHHGAVLIVPFENSIRFAGRFSFFREQNPYRELSVQAAMDSMPQFKRERNSLNFDGVSAYVRTTLPEQENYQYWLRMEDLTGDLLMVAYWGNRYSFMCRLSRNSLDQ